MKLIFENHTQWLWTCYEPTVIVDPDSHTARVQERSFILKWDGHETYWKNDPEGYVRCLAEPDPATRVGLFLKTHVTALTHPSVFVSLTDNGNVGCSEPANRQCLVYQDTITLKKQGSRVSFRDVAPRGGLDLTFLRSWKHPDKSIDVVVMLDPYPR